MLLGGMDVAQVNPYRSGQSKLPVHMAWFAPHRPATVTEFRGDQGLPVTQWTMPTRPNHMGRRRMGDDVSRGQKGGSVEVSYQYLGKYNDIVCWSFI